MMRKRRKTAKAVILVLGLILSFFFSCKKNPEQQAGASQPASPAPNSPPGLQEKVITPEMACKFDLDRLRVENEANRKYLSILKAARVHDPQLDSSISRYEKETAVRLRELKYKHQMSFQDLAAASAKSGREAYLDAHLALKMEMDDLAQANKKLDEEIYAELERLGQKSPAVPAQKPLHP